MDRGKAAGNYFIAGALICLLSIPVVALAGGTPVVDLNFILFLLAGSALRRHSPTARKWVLRLSVAGLVIVLVLVPMCRLFWPGYLRLIVLGNKIVNPGWLALLTFCLLGAAAILVPILLLTGRKAQAEFEAGAMPNGHQKPGG